MFPQTEVVSAPPARILIVEDEGVIASHIQSRLTNAGYEAIGVAQSSEEALALVEESLPDLILMDIHIKGSRDGIDTAAAVQARHDIPIVYLTAHTDRETINRAKVSGASNFLSKPIHSTTLSTSIEMTLHKHRADSEVRRQRAWMSTVVNTMADAMIVVDANQIVRYLNAVAEELSGWTAASAIGRDLSSVLPLSDSTSGLPANDQFRPARSVSQLPPDLLALRRSGKSFPIEAEVAPSYDGDRIAGAIITFRDATTRRSRECEIRQQEKMRAVGRLAAGIAHDFNNALLIIIGFADELIRNSSLATAEVSALNEIRKAGDHAAKLTRQLLGFSRTEFVDRQILNLNDVITDTFELLRRVAGNSVKFQIDLDPNLAPIRADSGQLKQVLMNLVSNANDAMPEGGRIKMETANLSLPREGKSGKPAEAFVSLTISDTGAGIAAEVAGKLFEPFFTTKAVGKGTGLGLSIVHSIVTDLGGSIHVDSEPGQGAAFTIYLPCVNAVVPTGVAEPAPAGQLETLTILLVEDNEDVRRLLIRNLVESGCLVLEAENGEDAIAVSAAHHGDIDILIADVVMPKTSGFEAAHTLFQQRPGLKTIFISGYCQEVLETGAPVPSGSHFLPKPFYKADLIRHVNELVRNEKSVRARPAL